MRCVLGASCDSTPLASSAAINFQNMKRSTHFRGEDYSKWFRASANMPVTIGWYECKGWRFNGYLHLHWDGAAWRYFGSRHIDPKFPEFGRHRSDQWRGLNKQHVRKTARQQWIDVTGQRFGLLTGLCLEYLTRHGAFWMFQCDCGQQRVAQVKWVIAGNTASCGCRQWSKGAVPVKRPWDKKISNQAAGQPN